VTLDRVEIAGIVVRNVAASVLEGAHPDPALLGMSWLSRVGMREDSGVLYLEER
jgi:aspartyl protease family protein